MFLEKHLECKLTLIGWIVAKLISDIDHIFWDFMVKTIGMLFPDWQTFPGTHHSSLIHTIWEIYVLSPCGCHFTCLLSGPASGPPCPWWGLSNQSVSSCWRWYARRQEESIRCTITSDKTRACVPLHHFSPRQPSLHHPQLGTFLC